MHVYQKIFFYLFILIYLILCPILLLYSFGFLSKSNLEPKGELYLSSTPKGASVYIGNRRYSEKTPVLIKDVLPGTYDIRLAVKGYHLWDYRVHTVAGRTIRFDKVLFMPKAWKKEELVAESFTDLIPLPGTDFFILTKSANTEDHYIYNWKKQKLTSLVQEIPEYKGLVVLSYDIVPNSPTFILRALSGQGEKVLLIRPQEYLIGIKDITGLFTEEPFRVGWNPEHEDYIFSLQNGHLNQIDVNKGGILPNFFEDVRGFGFLEGGICIINKRNILLWADYSGNRVLTLLDDPVLTDFIFPEKGFVEVKPLGSDLMLFLGEEGYLTANVEPYRFAQEILGITPNREAMRVLFWQKNKLGLLDFRSKAQMRIDFERIPRMVLLYDKGRYLSQAYWVHEGSYSLFRDDNDIFLFELIRGSDKSLNRVVQIMRNSSVYYSEDSGILYYLDRITAHLFGIEIIPKRDRASNNIKD